MDLGETILATFMGSYKLYVVALKGIGFNKFIDTPWHLSLQRVSVFRYNLS